ncbi:hypothetical protein K402DRAFT_399020 [Aulographum hederae CBS 113979]|uniref:Uncharacterized protein n=1 Tax=Aulographum hederae CBS 113979 TaxID=1176131 RepID=A0A6G1GJD2_9PEZI|nr:hypothetical protein K402DRAFT_399020 [Aulographum hederae CBS 113979]
MIEAFNARALCWWLSVAIFLSLAVALVYGFLMDKDFATGFGIASWMVTSVGFLIAVVAAGQWLGLESADSFGSRNVFEEGDVVREKEGRRDGMGYESSSDESELWLGSKNRMMTRRRRRRSV